MRLNEWQLAFEGYLLGEQPLADAALSRSLVGGPTLDVETGLAIYHNAYRARLQEVMEGDFPSIRRWLGEQGFSSLVAAYLHHSPSRHFSLRWLGQGFADFIPRHVVSGEGLPLAELARLEWAFTLAFDAPEAVVLSVPDLAALDAAQWPELQLRLAPCVQWLLLRYNSLAQWQAVKAEVDFPPSALLEQEQVCLVWRSQRVCRYRSVSAGEAQALQGMCAGQWSFAELCAELAVTYDEGAPLQAASWLKQWAEDGLVWRYGP
ncbi:putative DNA-binding domain-containing protein [Pseudomonas sp. MPFS]|uniref:HvfC/BufC N-terminal domain-containing protein n=1 Tax=Pseudomonas sp. MPFS TaxID=2795724 RepID=UPI001F13B6B2|nr:DNA-binding domain-containing protein [Pseudomonas sp. MPFS]UMZ12063.1 putative DNA-binding domain-containing protein [Pseudomonas sp. MPFS]